MPDQIGYVSSIQTAGTLEGPGVRFVVFLQGCPLRCIYCHNPETWEVKGGALYTVDEIIKKLLRYKPYFGDKGGITLSGGEPLHQSDFSASLLKKAREHGVNTAICTSGTASLSDSKKVLEYTDLVITDLKFTNKEDYSKYCKGDYDTVINFLKLTEQMQIPLWIRQVIIPGINDTEKSVTELCNIAKQFKNLELLDLLPFRKLCIEKYDNMNIPFQLKDTPETKSETIQKLKCIVKSKL